MKTVEHYICEFCRTEYNEKAKAEACESGHHISKKIRHERYVAITNDRKGYPLSIDIEMDNGDIVTYKR